MDGVRQPAQGVGAEVEPDAPRQIAPQLVEQLLRDGHLPAVAQRLDAGRDVDHGAEVVDRRARCGAGGAGHRVLAAVCSCSELELGMDDVVIRYVTMK